MLIRTPNIDDRMFILWMESLQNEFKLNNLQNAIVQKIIFTDDNIPVAYGICKRMAEAIILVNPDAPRVTRAKAMQELMSIAEAGARKENCEQLHCFVKREDMSYLLQKHFNFKVSCNQTLVKDI